MPKVYEKLTVLLIVYFIKMNVNIVNAVWDMKHIITKTCHLIAHAVIKFIGFSLIKNYDGRELCHNVLFSEENLHKDQSLLLIIDFIWMLQLDIFWFWNY